MEPNNFYNFLQRGGAEIETTKSPWEIARFKTPRGVHVVYRNKAGKHSYSDPHAEQAHQAYMGRKPWMAPAKVKRQPRGYLQTAIIQRDGEGCFYCPHPFTPSDPPTIEHLLALGSGGNNVLANLALAHESCNREADCMAVTEKVRLRDKKRSH